MNLFKKLSLLNGKELLILWLRCLGYKDNDIAEHLDISNGYIRIMFYRLREKIINNV